MSKKRFVFPKLLIAVIAVLFQSCAREGVYLSNSTNTPNLEKKNDANLNGYFGVNHFEFQGSYSPINHIGVIGNEYFSTIQGAQFFEGGIGYYNSIPNTKIHFDVFAGFGSGKRSYSFTQEEFDFVWMANVGTETSNIYTAYNKLFLQGSFYFLWNDKYQLALTGQIANLHFNTMQIEMEDQSQNQFVNGGNSMPLSVLYNQTFKDLNLFNYSTALTFKMKVFKHFKFVSQIMTNTTPGAPYNGNYNNVYFNGRSLCINLGLQYSIFK